MALAGAEDPIWLSALKGDGLVARSDRAPQSGLVGDAKRPGYLPDAFEASGNAPPIAAIGLGYSTPTQSAPLAPAATTVISTAYNSQHAAAAAAAVTARLPPAFSDPPHGTIILALEERAPETLQLGFRPIFSLQSPGEPDYRTVIIRGPTVAPAAETGETLPALAQSQAKTAPKAVPVDLPSAGYRLQLASLKNRGGAEREAARLLAAFEDLLRNRPLLLVAADLGDRGQFHRIQFSGYPSFGTAAAICSELKARGQDCLVLKPLYTKSR
jgi:hypothetical protein